MLVPAIVMCVVIHLERAVMFDRPGDFLAQERPQDFRGEAVVVLRRKPVAYVMEEGGGNPVLVGTLAIGARCGLKSVPKAADLVAGKCLLVLQAQFAQHAIGGFAVVLMLELAEKFVILLGAVLHGDEAY